MKKKINILVILLLLVFTLFGCSSSAPVIPEYEYVSTNSGYYVNDYTYLTLEESNISFNAAYSGDEVNKARYTVSYSQNRFSKQGRYPVTITIKEGSAVVDTLKTIVVVDYPANEEFDEYCDEMFVYFLEGDQLSSNIYFCDYEAFGLEHEDAIWYTYSEYTDEEYASDKVEVKRLRSELNSYKRKHLSFNQLNTYNVIDGVIKSYEAIVANRNFSLMSLGYVDQYGGYCADFPTDMEAYTIRRLEDITDIISFFDSSYDAFMSYFEYIKDREEAGFGLSAFTLGNFRTYLEGVVEEGADYYLYNVMAKKIENSKDLLGLTDTDIDAYKAQLRTAFDEKFIKAHSDLSEQVKSYMLKANKSGGYLRGYTEGYLQNYEKGTVLYESLLRNKLGMYDLTMDEYISLLDTQLKAYSKEYNKVTSSKTSVTDISDGYVDITRPSEPADLIAYLKEFASTIVPELESEPVIDVTYMDSTATENTTTLAYYMKSALDSRENEYIHLNKQSLGSNKLETINTLAHEGYPGHLYEYVSTKENPNLSNIVRIMTNTGHGEGWAKYVEIALDRYIAEQKNSTDWTTAMEMTIYWDLFVYTLYARLDVGINYQGWKTDEVEEFLSDQRLNTSIAKDLYQTLIEIPGQYAPYGYGLIVVYELHNDGKEALGEYYNEVEFNRALIEHGWVGLDQTQYYVNTYISEQKFLNNISE